MQVNFIEKISFQKKKKHGKNIKFTRTELKLLEKGPKNKIFESTRKTSQ